MGLQWNGELTKGEVFATFIAEKPHETVLFRTTLRMNCGLEISILGHAHNRRVIFRRQANSKEFGHSRFFAKQRPDNHLSRFQAG
jgi:hypothetical protein